MRRDQEGLNRLKIALPVFVLVVLFLLLIFNVLRVKYLEQDALESLDKKVVLVTRISELLHELQKERGMSVGYLSGSQKSFGQKLLHQKAVTDRVLAELQKYYERHRFPFLEEHTKALKLLHNIDRVRTMVMQNLSSVKKVSSYYTELNDALLSTVLGIIKSSEFGQLNNDAMAFVNLLYLEENSGLERAVGTNIISTQNLNQRSINTFNSFIVKESVYKSLFLKFASKTFQNEYKKSFSDAFYSEIIEMRSDILNANTKRVTQIEPYKWFSALSVMIDRLKDIDHKLSNEMLEYISTAYHESRVGFLIYLLLGLVSFVVFIVMIVIIVGLKKSETKLKNILNRYVISSTTDLHGKITGVSKAFCDISGYKEEELLGKPHNIVRHPDVPKELFKEMWQTIKADKIWQGEVKNLRADGSCYWVTAVVSPLYYNGKKVGYTSVRQDISDSKRIEELNRNLQKKILLEVQKSREKDRQMIQQSRLAQMGEMISMIAHQWRQPLTAISATSSSMILKSRRQEHIESHYVAKKSRKILEYAEHLSSTINDFRDFFKPDKDKKEVTLNRLIESVLGIVETSLAYQHIDISVDITYEEPFVSYPNELKQVILNLIKNAEDVLLERRDEKRPQIKLFGYKEGEKLMIEVRDNAGGVPEEIIDKIFDPYFSTKLKKDGTGLGLYMSKTIVEDHCGGHLRVYNTQEGAAFVIELPLNLEKSQK